MRRLIVALTGASGIIYGVRALEILRRMPDLEAHVIVSPSALQTLVAETDHPAEYVRDLADVLYPPVATSNSPICGQVKFPQVRRQERKDCYSESWPFTRRLAASLRR